MNHMLTCTDNMHSPWSHKHTLIIATVTSVSVMFDSLLGPLPEPLLLQLQFHLSLDCSWRHTYSETRAELKLLSGHVKLSSDNFR